MKKILIMLGVLLATVLLVLPAQLAAQPAGARVSNPPVAQSLVREGDFAVKLSEALGLGSSAGETEAESGLGAVGIAPRNGWIADYPVTPDIIGELQASVSDAADARRITLDRDAAVKALGTVAASFDVAVTPYTPDGSVVNPESYENYPDPSVVDDYYASEGPPVITYYQPPPDYYYLYTWVPYPFWWSGYWFGGYFCLVDFHRTVHVGRRVEVISNHFVDHRTNRVLRIDPMRRFNGRTFGGIGAPRGRRDVVPPGITGGAPRIFSGHRERTINNPAMRTGRPWMPQAGGRISGAPAREGRSMTPPSGGAPGGRGGQGVRSPGGPGGGAAQHPAPGVRR